MTVAQTSFCSYGAGDQSHALRWPCLRLPRHIQDWHRLRDARRSVCSSQPAQLEKPPGTRSPTALAPPSKVTPRSPPRLRWVSAAQESRKAPCIAKSAAPPRPGTFLPREVVLREMGGEVQILVRRVLARPLVRTTVTPKSRHLFERVRIAVVTTGTFSHLV